MRVFSAFIFVAVLAVPVAATDIIVLSDEGWCTLYLNGKEAGEIPLNDDKTVLEDVYPGTYELKAHDAFDKLWFEGVLVVPDVEYMVVQIEPDIFEVLASGLASYEKPKSGIPKEATTIRSEVKKRPVSDLGSLLYVTTEPEDCAVWVEGRKVGTAPYIDFEPPKGSIELEIKREGYEPIEEVVNIEEGTVTHLHIEVK
jgi:hypothetical protein